jgi:hypothetical protein
MRDSRSLLYSRVQKSLKALSSPRLSIFKAKVAKAMLPRYRLLQALRKTRSYNGSNWLRPDTVGVYSRNEIG